MRNVWKLLAVIAVAGGLAACDKEPGGTAGTENPTDFSGGCVAVDLGLSVKWASYNVGATAPEEYGSYFAWGENGEKTSYGWSKEGDYKWGYYNSNFSPPYMIIKYFDVQALLPEDDAATMNWGTKWRMPTIDEIKELLDKKKCTWTLDKVKGGYTVVGVTTGNSIFLPAAGYRVGTDLYFDGVDGQYWSSSLLDFYCKARCLVFCVDNSNDNSSNVTYRYFGLPVRAVTDY